MSVILTIHEGHKDYYGLKLLSALSILLLLLAYTSFYLMQNYYAKSFLEFNLSGKKVYFLKSDTLKNMYEKNGMDYEIYQERIKYFKKLSLQNAYESKDIYASELESLEKNSKLVVLDVMSLSKNEIDDIEQYVDRGGKLIFNFTSGFLNPALKYQKDNLVSRITGMHIDAAINTVRFDSNSTAYMSTKMLSPLTKDLKNGQALEVVLYDPLPILKTNKTSIVDAYMTTWSQSNYMSIGKNRELKEDQSALIWHGYKEHGKWVYFSFPSYSFMEVSPSLYAKLFQDMLAYLDEEITPGIYPYIDAKNVVFISEDTEYKYENLEQFYSISLKNSFPVTAFCVAKLAKEYAPLMELVSQSEYMEIGSHSYTHKKIVGESDAVYERETVGSKNLLYKLTKQEIHGFRPPREEIDKKMIHLLEDGGYKYILGAGENRLSPYFIGSILMIPRHGTDDYSYLVNLDWDSAEILEEMKHQVNVLTKLNAIYTMSTHTHLMSYASNINITDKFMQYVNGQKEMKPMNGFMLHNRVSQRKNLTIETNITMKKMVMSLSNENNTEVKDLHISLFVDRDIEIKSVESEIIGVETKLVKKESGEYTLIVKSLKPKSQIVLFLNYDKNI